MPHWLVTWVTTVVLFYYSACIIQILLQQFSVRLCFMCPHSIKAIKHLALLSYFAAFPWILCTLCLCFSFIALLATTLWTLFQMLSKKKNILNWSVLRLNSFFHDRHGAAHDYKVTQNDICAKHELDLIFHFTKSMKVWNYPTTRPMCHKCSHWMRLNLRVGYVRIMQIVNLWSLRQLWSDDRESRCRKKERVSVLYHVGFRDVVNAGYFYSHGHVHGRTCRGNGEKKKGQTFALPISNTHPRHFSDSHSGPSHPNSITHLFFSHPPSSHVQTLLRCIEIKHYPV